MRQSMVVGRLSASPGERGRRRSPGRDGRDLEDLREDRDWPPFGELDDPTRRGDIRPRKHGGHGCDRVRRRGTRRQID